jgi:hypothetical protein
MENAETPPKAIPQAPAAQPPEETGGLRLGAASKAAAGLEALGETLAFSAREMGLVRGVRTLLKLNQRDGFDCQSCAWPKSRRPPQRRRVLRERGEGRRGRGDHPKRSRRSSSRASVASSPGNPTTGSGSRAAHRADGAARGREHYEPIPWDDAFDLVAAELRALARPTSASSIPRAARATRRRSSTSSLSAPSARTTCPIARTCATSRADRRSDRNDRRRQGTSRCSDFDEADAIFIIGPESGHESSPHADGAGEAKRRGCKIVSINPCRDGQFALQESAGSHEPAQGGRLVLGPGTAIFPTSGCRCVSTATWRFSGHHEGDARGGRGTPGKRSSTGNSSGPHDGLRRAHQGTDLTHGHAGGTSSRQRIVPRADRAAARSRWRPGSIIACWAMGLTQQPERRRDHPGGREFPASGRKHRPARRGRVSRARAQQRPGRPHDGHLGADG